MGLAMRTYTCDTCGEQVPRPEAAIRSVALRQVHYCRACFAEIMELVVPPQRESAEQLSRSAV